MALHPAPRFFFKPPPQPTWIFLETVGSGLLAVPLDWNNDDNTIWVLGGGGGASSPDTSAKSGAGAAISIVSNAVFTPGSGIQFYVGAGGPSTGFGGFPGGDSWIGGYDYASSLCAAKGGGAGFGASHGTGGQASAGIGDTKYSGGNGDVGGGGGAAGPGGAGGNATLTEGGQGGNGLGGLGGAAGTPGADGGDGTEWDANHGSGGGNGATTGGSPLPRSGRFGAGGARSTVGTAGTYGQQGLIVIRYTPVEA